MQSEKKAKDSATFEPRSVAQSKLYSDNVRLQRLCYLHRKHIRGMQTQLELLRLKYQNAVATLETITKAMTPAEKRDMAYKMLAEARTAEGYAEITDGRVV